MKPIGNIKFSNVSISASYIFCDSYDYTPNSENIYELDKSNSGLSLLTQDTYASDDKTDFFALLNQQASHYSLFLYAVNSSIELSNYTNFTASRMGIFAASLTATNSKLSADGLGCEL